MTKNEKIEILKRKCNFKPDIYRGLYDLECKVGIKIGVRFGNNLANLAKNEKFKEGMLYGLDSWREYPNKPEINDEGYSQKQLDNQYASCVKRFQNLPFVEIIRSLSIEGSNNFSDDYFDFIYIDASHDYDSVKEDLNIWWPKLKNGGVFSGHDYFPDRRVWRGKEVGVYKAVNEFVKEKETKVHHTTSTELEGGVGISCNSFFIIK